ncbi:MAG: hypothetical protein AB7S52_12710, partial [Sphaerochaetaceae bacterium]
MKKNLWAVMVVVLVALVFMGCTSGKAVEEPKGPVIIGAEGQRQPDWVQATPKNADVHYETGYAKLSNKANSIKRANADAKEKISQ